MYTNIHTCENRERYTAAAASRDNGHYVFLSRCLITKCNPSAHSCLSLFGLLLLFCFCFSFLSSRCWWCFVFFFFSFALKKNKESLSRYIISFVIRFSLYLLLNGEEPYAVWWWCAVVLPIRRPYRVRSPFIDTIYHFGWWWPFVTPRIQFVCLCLCVCIRHRARSAIYTREGSRNRIISC